MTREIPLTQGFVALVDDEDYAHLMAVGRWHATVRPTNVYAANGKRVYLHRFLVPGAPEVDHINGNGLDNRRANLRPSTARQNHRNVGLRANNTSGFKGVSRDRLNGRWEAYITADLKRRRLGRFATPEEAARAYDAAARELHGEFARLNFPERTAA